MLDLALSYKDGLAVVAQDKKYGFINKRGEIEKPLIYDSAHSFHDDLALVYLNNEGFIYINKYGIKAVPGNYHYANSFSEGLAGAYKNYKYGFIDKTGKFIIPPIYDSVGDFKEGYASVKLNKKSLLIDKNGEVFIEAEEINGNFQNGFVSAKLQHFLDICGIIHKEENLCHVFNEYSYIGIQSDGLFKARAKNSWDEGFINERGKVEIPFIYTETLPFSEGLARVKIKGYYCYIDKFGKTIIPNIYDDAWSFKNGIACVKLKGQCGIIDKTGQWIKNIEIMDDAHCYYVP